MILATLLAFASSATLAQPMMENHAHHHMMSAPPAAPIVISVNPEARVSVVLSGPLPAPGPCSRPVDVPVQVQNDSFITSRLEARLVGLVPAGVSVAFDPRPLSGKALDTRGLRIFLAKPGPVDLTVSFKPHNDVPDLGGRDRVHFVLDCR